MLGQNIAKIVVEQEANVGTDLEAESKSGAESELAREIAETELFALGIVAEPSIEHGRAAHFPQEGYGSPMHSHGLGKDLMHTQVVAKDFLVVSQCL